MAGRRPAARAICGAGGRMRPDRQGEREADACRMFGRAALRGSFMRQDVAEGRGCRSGLAALRAACGPPFGSDRPRRKSRRFARSRTALERPESCGKRNARRDFPAGVLVCG